MIKIINQLKFKKILSLFIALLRIEIFKFKNLSLKMSVLKA